MGSVGWRGATLRYEVAGQNERIPVVFVNPVGYGAWVWGWLHSALVGPRRTVTWDLPGTGSSELPTTDLSVVDLTGALEAVLKAIKVDRMHLIGAGLGGAIALEHARQFGRARSLTLFGTPPTGKDVDEEALRSLDLTGENDLDWRSTTCRESLAGAFTRDYRERADEIIDQVCTWREREDASGKAWEAQATAFRAYRPPGPLYEIDHPALVGHGTDDPVVSPTAGSRLVDRLPHARFVPVEGRRLAFVESARPVADRVSSFLAEVDGSR